MTNALKADEPRRRLSLARGNPAAVMIGGVHIRAVAGSDAPVSQGCPIQAVA